EIERPAIVEFHMLRAGIDLGRATAEHQIDPFFLEEGLVAQDQLVLAGAAEQEIFRKRRPLIGQPGFVADYGDVFGVTGFARSERALDAGVGRADNNKSGHGWLVGMNVVRLKNISSIDERDKENDLAEKGYRPSVVCVAASMTLASSQH